MLHYYNTNPVMSNESETLDFVCPSFIIKTRKEKKGRDISKSVPIRGTGNGGGGYHGFGTLSTIHRPPRGGKK